jgi:hypothetical protein
MSPSSDIGPSPVTSTGTEIEDEATEETAEQANLDAAPPAQVSSSPNAVSTDGRY